MKKTAITIAISVLAMLGGAFGFAALDSDDSGATSEQVSTTVCPGPATPISPAVPCIN